MTDPAVPLNFQTGLGYSPNSGPPVGGWSYMPVSTFFGDNLPALLPEGRSFFGRIPRYRSRFSKFGNRSYPLSNQANPYIDMKTFPLTPVGPGNTSGGDGGVFLQGMPSFQQYWGYGKKRRRSRRKSTKRRSRRKRSTKRRSRRRRRSNKNWIQKADLKKGALRDMAPPEAFTKRGTLKDSWLREAAKESGVLGQRARAALTLKKLSKRRRRKRRSK